MTFELVSAVYWLGVGLLGLLAIGLVIYGSDMWLGVDLLGLWSAFQNLLRERGAERLIRKVREEAARRNRP